MKMKTRTRNPFYALLILVGIAFVLSASSYGVMAIRGIDRSEPALTQTGLLGFMDHYGDWLLSIEVLLLGLLTVAAIGTDEIGIRRSKTVEQASEDREPAVRITTQSQKGTEL